MAVPSASQTEWFAESVRFTTFPAELAPVATEVNWWEEVTGAPPETKVIRPRLQGFREEGPFERGVLKLVVGQNRIDWILSMPPKEEEESEIFQMLGPAREATDLFTRLMAKWFRLTSIPPLKRLAFGAVLLQPVQERIDGYRRLQSFLPSVRIDETSSDFLYQINRRRPSTTGMPNLEMNRLTKWSVSVQIFTAIAIQGTSVTQVPGETRHFLRLELDINTAPEFQGPFPPERLADAFQELRQLGEEIAAHGDIP